MPMRRCAPGRLMAAEYRSGARRDPGRRGEGAGSFGLRCPPSPLGYGKIAARQGAGNEVARRSVRTLYDIVHPADVHFFRRAIGQQLARGDAVLVTSRHKDVTVDLLDAFGIRHQVISRRGRGMGGLLLELGLRDSRLLRAARAFAPDITVANNSPSAAHVGRLLGIPSLVFDDTEIHRLNRMLYLPAVTEVHSPDCFRMRLGRKHRLYPSYHALAYLHPAHFTLDTDLLARAGLVPGRRRVVVRFVESTASHDFGARGLDDAARRHLIETLGRWAEVKVSTEAALPPALAPLRCPLPMHQIHHLIAGSTLFVADSATMCAEAAVLGVPAIYLDDRGRGYTDDLSTRYGLCFRFPVNAVQDALAQAQAILLGSQRAAFVASRGRLLQDKFDPVRYQIDTLDRLSARTAAKA